MKSKYQRQAVKAALAGAVTKPPEKKPAQPPAEKNPHKHARLPNYSTVNAVWLADRGVWAGVLVVTGVGRFEAEHKNQFGCLEALDKLYRAHLAAQEGGPK